MVSDQSVKRGTPRRRLSAAQKYEVLTRQVTQREAAERYGADRSTAVTATAALHQTERVRDSWQQFQAIRKSWLNKGTIR